MIQMHVRWSSCIMIVLIGNSTELKRNIIHRIVSNKIKFVENNDDVKAYYFLGHYIVNTPEIRLGKIGDMFKKCNIIRGANIKTCILVVDDTIDTRTLIQVYDTTKDFSMYLVIFNVNNQFNIPYRGNIHVASDYNELKEILVHRLSEPYVVSGKFMFLGITNVGKSSIINKFVNFNVMSVKSAKHTTKEVSTIPVMYDNRNVLLYDTFGLENKTKDRLNAIVKTITNVNRVFVVVDPYVYNRNINKYIVEFLYKHRCNTTIIFNKMDIVVNDNVRKYRIFKEINDIYPTVHTIYLSTYDDSFSVSSILDYHYNVKKRDIINDYINKVVKQRFSNILYMRHIKCVTTHYKFIVTLKRNAKTLSVLHIRNFVSRIFNIKDLILEFVIIGQYD